MNKISVSRITNPLTIIFIFSGVVESSGVLVLHALPDNLKSIYLWFLVIYPSALMLFFFITLWTNRNVFYAPSDFKDDEAYLMLMNITNKNIKEISPENYKKYEPSKEYRNEMK